MFSKVVVLGGGGGSQPEVKWECSRVFAYLAATQNPYVEMASRNTVLYMVVVVLSLQYELNPWSSC